MRRYVIFLIIATICVSCTHRQESVDGLMRSRVDALNKAAFRERYHDAARGESYARRALAYINDSLPHYDDGRLRAWNNLAYAFSFRSMHDSAMCYVDSVLSYEGRCANRQVEQVLAHLVEARLLQRNCDIAGSYLVLHEVEHSGLLDNDGGGWLYNLARSEFYITTTTLNYHYRSKSQYEQAELLTAMEARRGQLRCDYQEDMSFNYALAYGYYALCADTAHQVDYLSRALRYCSENLHLMDDSARFSTYHLADTYQLIGFMLWGRNISAEAWRSNESEVDEICDYVGRTFRFDVSGGTMPTAEAGTAEEMSDRNVRLAYAFLREATALFFLHDNPYQRMGALVSTGRFCLTHGDTATARTYFGEALLDTALLGVAPKFEAMLYEGLLTSGSATGTDEVALWTRREIDLLNYIKQNERADFMLQLELAETQRKRVAYMVFSVVLLALAVGLALSLVLLRRRTLALQRETERLREAKRQDVERIANVETCLSVLRHDITPFISYLQNDKLPDSLKHEVTSQLIRTFENIKNWTNLSIPNGLQFRCSSVSVSELFESVSRSVNNFRGGSLQMLFEDSSLTVRGDRQLLEIMLRNLVNNAIQHTESGAVHVAAQSFADDGRFVEMTVSDTGCGMTAEEVENLFRTDRLPRSADTASTGYGTGFGLILCRYIIKKHDDNTLRGCRIWAESVPGTGSTFHLLVAKQGD